MKRLALVPSAVIGTFTPAAAPASGHDPSSPFHLLPTKSGCATLRQTRTE